MERATLEYIDSRRKAREVFADKATQRRLYPYPDYAQSTSSGAVFVHPQDLLSDPQVQNEINELLSFVNTHGLIRKRK